MTPVAHNRNEQDEKIVTFTETSKTKPARKIIILGHHRVNEIIKREFQYTACVPIET